MSERANNQNIHDEERRLHIYKSSFDNFPFGLAYLNREGNVIESNSAMQEILESINKDLSEIPLPRIISGRDTEWYTELISGIRDVYEVEDEYNDRWLRFLVVSQNDQKGGRNILVVAEDTTPHAIALSRARHEINNKFTSLKGWAELFYSYLERIRETERALQKDRIENYSSQINKTTKALLRTLNRELQYPLDPDRIRKESTDINHLLKNFVESLEPVLQSKRIILLYDIPEGVQKVLVDPEKLLAVMDNIVRNAIHAIEMRQEYMSELGIENWVMDFCLLSFNSAIIPAIKVNPQAFSEVVKEINWNVYQALKNIQAELYTALRFIEGVGEKGGDVIEIIISDSGVGIPRENLKKIFQRGFTTKSKTKYQGSGIGLYDARQIIKGHHGRIEVFSLTEEMILKSPGKYNPSIKPGTLFLIRFPAS